MILMRNRTACRLLKIELQCVPSEFADTLPRCLSHGSQPRGLIPSKGYGYGLESQDRMLLVRLRRRDDDFLFIAIKPVRIDDFSRNVGSIRLLLF